MLNLMNILIRYCPFEPLAPFSADPPGDRACRHLPLCKKTSADDQGGALRVDNVYFFFLQKHGCC